MTIPSESTKEDRKHEVRQKEGELLVCLGTGYPKGKIGHPGSKRGFSLAVGISLDLDVLASFGGALRLRLSRFPSG